MRHWAQRISPLPLIGEPKVPSPQSKTKANAVHVGLSPQLEAAKALTSWAPNHWFHCRNNKLLTVQPMEETKDAMEVIYPLLINTLWRMVLNLKKTIHTLHLTIIAVLTNQKLFSNQKDSNKLPPMTETHWLLPLPNNQYQSALKQILMSSNSILAVFFPIALAEPVLTIVSPMLDTLLQALKHIGSSKILGEKIGDKKATFGLQDLLQAQAFVALTKNQFIPPIDWLIINIFE